MNKKLKSLAGMLLALLCVFQLALIAPASAENEPQADPKASVGYVLFVKGEDGKYVGVTDEEAVLGKNSGFNVDFGKDGGTVEALRKNGVTVSPAKGYNIFSVFAVGTEGRLDAKAASLTRLAVCDDITTGKLTLAGDFFAETTEATVIEAEKKVGSIINGVAAEKKRVEDANALKDKKETMETEHYFIHVYLEKLDASAPIQLTYAPGEAVFPAESSVLVDGGNSFTAESPEVGEGEEKKAPEHTVLPLVTELGEKAIKEQGLEFVLWQLVFPNGSHCSVNVGDVISPYVSCTVEAKWKHVISVVFDDRTKVYDSTALTGSVKSVAGLKTGERLSLDEGVLTASLTDVGEKSYSISTDDIAAGKLHIFNASGSDITADYIDPQEPGNIHLFPGTLSVTARPLTVSITDTTQLYNAAPLTASAFTSNGLADGHSITLTYTGSQTVPGVSDSGAENVKVMSGESDVTANYSITVNGGKLTVYPLIGESRRSISVKATDGRKTYDGKALVPSQYTIVSGELLEGESLSVTFNGEQLDAGTSQSGIAACAVRNGETDVSENYIITTEGGSLTVDRLSLTVTAESGKKVIDDTPLTCSRYTVSPNVLLSGHKITDISFSGSQTSVGSSANVIVPGSIVISDAYGSDVTANYDLTLVPGTLTVTDKPISDITLTIGSYTKVYDGLPVSLTASDIKVTSGTIPAGYTLEPTFSTTSLVNVGKETVNIVNIVIKDPNGVDATSRFSISREPGTVEITPRTLTIETKSAAKTYDGKALTEKSTPTVTGRLEGQQISLRITGTQTKVGSSSNTVSDVSVTVKDTKEDVTGNYSIVINAGTLTVTEASGGSTSDKPGTGDASRLGLLVGLIVFALAGIVAVVIIITKRSGQG